MNKPITKETLFKPTPSRSESKADLTDKAAREILDAEAARRAEKTRKLRELRLSAESGEKA